jgi:hypothetical protein
VSRDLRHDDESADERRDRYIEKTRQFQYEDFLMIGTFLVCRDFLLMKIVDEHCDTYIEKTRRLRLCEIFLMKIF